MKKLNILLVCPHPDDGEVIVQQLCAQGIKAGYEVHELLSCCDEYGTSRNDFKGKRIQKIRRNEMIQAAKCYGLDEQGNSLLKLHWQDYIDAHVPFNRSSVKRLKKFITKINPDIIAGPDPFLQFDGHTDHINTGLNYFFALKQIKPVERPKLMLFFQTTKPDIFLPVKFTKIIKCARIAHKSQFSPLMVKFMGFMSVIFSIILAPKTGGRYVQGYRKVKFDPKYHKLKGPFQIFMHYLMGRPQKVRERLTPPHPSDLGLNTDPKEEIK